MSADRSVRDEEQWLRVRAVARIFDVQPQTIRKWIRCDALKAVQLPDKSLRIPMSEVRRVLSALK